MIRKLLVALGIIITALAFAASAAAAPQGHSWTGRPDAVAAAPQGFSWPGAAPEARAVDVTGPSCGSDHFEWLNNVNLVKGQCIKSIASPRNWFIYQTDGNVVVYSGRNGSVLWSPNVLDSGNHLKLQRDGNVVLYNAYGGVEWSAAYIGAVIPAGDNTDHYGLFSYTFYAGGGSCPNAYESDGTWRWHYGSSGNWGPNQDHMWQIYRCS